MEENSRILREGQKASLIIIGVSTGLVILKAAAGVVSNSVVLMADALDSGSDVVSAIASYLGLRISQRKPDERFPYGYYKAESLASLFIGLAIIYAALALMVQGYHRLFVVSENEYSGIALAAAAVSGITALLASRYLKKRGTELRIKSLLATSADRLKDFFASVIIFVTILLRDIPYLEGVITFILAILVVRMGILFVRDAALALMDMNPSTGLEKKVRRIILSVQGVEDVKHIRLRSSGPFILGDAHVKVQQDLHLSTAHGIADAIEAQIKKGLRECESFTVHVEPFRATQTVKRKRESHSLKKEM